MHGERSVGSPRSSCMTRAMANTRFRHSRLRRCLCTGSLMRPQPSICTEPRAAALHTDEAPVRSAKPDRAGRALAGKSAGVVVGRQYAHSPRRFGRNDAPDGSAGGLAWMWVQQRCDGVGARLVCSRRRHQCSIPHRHQRPARLRSADEPRPRTQSKHPEVTPARGCACALGQRGRRLTPAQAVGQHVARAAATRDCGTGPASYSGDRAREPGDHTACGEL